MLGIKENKDQIIKVLNNILELELSGVVRYTHYALMVYGYNRIPIVDWLRAQASESLLHANQAGEYITGLGGHPSLKMGPLVETHKHDIGDILRESLEHEKASLDCYFDLLKLVDGQSVVLEEYARTLIAEEEQHTMEVDKMLRTPGNLQTFQD